MDAGLLPALHRGRTSMCHQSLYRKPREEQRLKEQNKEQIHPHLSFALGGEFSGVVLKIENKNLPTSIILPLTLVEALKDLSDEEEYLIRHT